MIPVQERETFLPPRPPTNSGPVQLATPTTSDPVQLATPVHQPTAVPAQVTQEQPQRPILEQPTHQALPVPQCTKMPTDHLPDQDLESQHPTYHTA